MANGTVPSKIRLAVTINARYYPVEGVADAYCLDGKFPGKRELRAVNMTLDREARGVFFSVLGSPADSRDGAPTWRHALTHLSEQLNDETGDIDTDINDLAEAAMDVTDPNTLPMEAAREPYFSGVILRDGEMAAVTVGDSLAFIYRHEVLYPLTGSDKAIEPRDLYGDMIEGMEDFIAGEAGAIRYSNIAQIEPGDMIVLCNGDVYDVLGQKEIMRVLADSEDQMDAAGMMLTAAASQMPGTPIQVAVAHVEAIKQAEHTSRFSLGRFATQAMEPVVAPKATPTPAPAPAPPPESDLGMSHRYERRERVDAHEPMPEPAPAYEPEPRYAPEPAYAPDEPMYDQTPDDRDEDASAFEAPPEQDKRPLFDFLMPTGRQAKEPPTDDAVYDNADTVEHEAYDEDPSKLPVFAYSSAAQRRRRERDAHDYDVYGERDPYDERDGYDDDYDERYDGYDDYDAYDDGYPPPRKRTDRRRRIIFYVILIAIILICIIALIKLLAGGKKPPVETMPPTTAHTPVVVPVETDPPVTEPPATEPPTTPAPTEPTPDDNIRKHTVEAGDTMWDICMRYYDRASENICNELAAYNGKDTVIITVGEVISIPPFDVLMGD